MLALLTRVLGRWSRRLAAPSLALAVLQTVAIVKLASVEVLRILEGLEVIDVEVLDVRMLAVSSDVACGDNESDSIGATSQSHFCQRESRTITRAEATMFPRQRDCLSSVRNAECAKSSAWRRNGKGGTRQNHGTDPGDDSARNQLICLYPDFRQKMSQATREKNSTTETFCRQQVIHLHMGMLSQTLVHQLSRQNH